MHPFVEEFARQVRGSHKQLRTIVDGLDEEALSWRPGEETNSVAVLVTHALGSEAEVLRLVRNRPSNRVRAQEFTVACGAADLLALIDEADALLEESAPAITTEDLRREWTRPSAQRITTPQTGLFWLLNNYGHLREHIAHIELTLQLYRLGRSR